MRSGNASGWVRWACRAREPKADRRKRGQAETTGAWRSEDAIVVRVELEDGEDIRPIAMVFQGDEVTVRSLDLEITGEIEE